MKLYFEVLYHLNAISGIFAMAYGLVNLQYIQAATGFALVNLLCVIVCRYNIKKIKRDGNWF